MTKQDDSPADIEAEKAILGGLFLDNELFYEDAEELSAVDFSLPSHQSIFAAINDILSGESEATSADIITISSELRRRGEIDRIGGVSYLASLTEGMPRRPQLRGYVAIIKQKAKLRRLMKMGLDLHLKAKQGYADADELIENLGHEVVSFEADERSAAVSIASVIPTIQAAIMEGRNLSLDRTEMNLTWGIEALDERTKGAFFGELTVAAADSGGGKTQFVAQMALENALKGIPVVIFSIEMSKEKFAQRMYTLMSDILTANLMRDPRGMNLHTHVPELQRVSALLAKLPIWIDDTSPLQLTKFIARCKSYTRKHKVQLIIADYLQLFEVPGNESAQVKTIMYRCRDYIKPQKKQHMVLLSQFSKEQGLVRQKRRSKGDLYGGAVIHHAAQNVLIITAENPNKKEPGSDLEVEIMIDKQREGPRGKVMCRRHGTSLRYIPAPPESEKKPDEQPKRNAESKRKPKPAASSGGEEEEGSGTFYEDKG